MTSPAVPPYSLTTTARWNFSACISRMRSDTRLVSGTKWAARRCDRTGVATLPRAHRPDQVLGVGDAHHVVDLLVDDRHAAEPDLEGPLEHRLDRLVGLDGDHVGPGHHHLAHHRVAELDDRVDEGALLGLDHVVLEGHVGHGQQLGLGHGRAQVLALLADEQVGQADQRPRERCGRARSATRADTSGALNRAARSGWWTAQFLGTASPRTKMTTISNTVAATTPQAPNQLRGQDADQGGHHQLADQHQQEHRVEEPLRVLGEADQHPGPAPPVLDQGQRLGPAHADQAGLGQGQHGRGGQQDHHHDEQRPRRPARERAGAGQAADAGRRS